MDYTKRWPHVMKFTFRVWPSNAFAREVMLIKAELQVDGFRLNQYEQFEVVHKYKAPGNNATFEMDKQDADIFLSIGTTGALMRKMIVRCPGTLDENIKKACYFEAEVVVYPKARRTKAYKGIAGQEYCRLGGIMFRCAEDEIPSRVEEFWRAHNSFRPCAGAVVVEKKHELGDVHAIATAILAGKVVAIPTRLASSAELQGLRDRLAYYTVEGRNPAEPGGILCGYQLCDGLVRFDRMLRPEDKAKWKADKFAKMHNRTREKGQENRRTFLVRQVVEKIAAHYGVSRERVMRRFNEDGVTAHLLKRAESIELPKHMVQAKTLMRRHVNESVAWLQFYIDGLGTSVSGLASDADGKAVQ